MHTTFRAATIAWLVISTGCGAAPVVTTPTTPAVPATRTVAGVVRFAARRPTPRGASTEQEFRPARLILVRARDAAGEIVGETRTSEQGAFEMQAGGLATQLELVSHVAEGELDLSTTTDRRGEVPHVFVTAMPQRTEAGPDPARNITLDIADENAFAGALHIVDTLLIGARTVRDWTGQSVPPCYSYWGRGVTTEWSYYRAEVVAGSGRYGIELLGGNPGQQETTDTDEHDEVIILHEFGHFVMDVMSTDSSHGGSHAGGALIDPGLAWEEGRASWFACAVMRAPLYLDTIGIEPRGELRVAQNIETGRGADGPRGIGSEAGVGEILWDISDGGEGDDALPDTDGDGVSLGAAAVFNAMRSLAQVPGSYPGISTFLRHLVRTQAVSHNALKNLLLAGGHPESMLPANDTSMWPIDIALGQTVGGKIDSQSDPAPHGGPPRARNGRDAVHAYRVQMTEAGRLDVMLRIHGSGAPQAAQDIDLELRDLRSDLLTQSSGTGPTEQVSYLVQAGWYIIYVRDGGRPTRANYELVATRGR